MATESRTPVLQATITNAIVAVIEFVAADAALILIEPEASV